MSSTSAKLGKEIELDLDWRHAELAIFREMIVHSVRQQNAKRAIFRGAWALLYAHYEGFSKYCLELYLDYMCRGLKDSAALSDRMFVYLIDKQIREAKSLPSEGIFAFFKSEIPIMRGQPPKSVLIDTKSNLWPELLESILAKLELEGYAIVEDARKITTLVARRNDIAHGKKVFIEDVSYYLEYENAVSDVMYALALAVVDKYSITFPK